MLHRIAIAIAALQPLAKQFSRLNGEIGCQFFSTFAQLVPLLVSFQPFVRFQMVGIPTALKHAPQSHIQDGSHMVGRVNVDLLWNRYSQPSKLGRAVINAVPPE